MDLSYMKSVLLFLTIVILYYKEVDGQIFIDRRRVPARNLASSSRLNSRTNSRLNAAQTNRIVTKTKSNVKQTTRLALSPTAPSRLRATTRGRATNRISGLVPTSPSRLRQTTRKVTSRRIQAPRPTSPSRLRTLTRARALNRIQGSSRLNLRQRRTCPTLRCPETSSSWCIVPSYYRLRNGVICRGCGANRCGGQDFEDRWKLGFG